MKNKYTIDTKVEGWIRETFAANSDEEAIELAKSSDYEPFEAEFLWDCAYYPRENEEYKIELYNNKDSIIYSNIEESDYE